MDRVGLSFKSPLSPDEIRTRYVQPLRAAVEGADPDAPAEHLLIFHVREFQAGLHLLRMTMQELGSPPGMLLHNLDASEPLY
jgi:hypothetical protein